MTDRLWPIMAAAIVGLAIGAMLGCAQPPPRSQEPGFSAFCAQHPGHATCPP